MKVAFYMRIIPVIACNPPDRKPPAIAGFNILESAIDIIGIALFVVINDGLIIVFIFIVENSFVDF